jgi:threonyl-tRNA synthetase
LKEEDMKNSKLDDMRHSGAHLLAYAVQNLYPNVKFAIGPSIDYGFYYDFDFGDIKITESDLPRIEKEMKKLKKDNYKFEKVEMTISEAKKFLNDNKQIYSLSLLNDIETFGSTVKKDMDKKNKKESNDTVTFYKSGDFINLCRGGHVDSFSEIGEFKLVSIAGAYFRGDEKNPMLTRIYAACFNTKKELDDYLKDREERRKNDHRIIGQKLKIFTFFDEVGQGLPIFLPKGEILKKLLIEYMREKQDKLGYIYVSTPIITNEKLFELSGHKYFYSDDMYKIIDKEKNIFYVKPMNCPFHHLVYKSEVRSYKDLPIKIAEDSPLYRYERSGTLSGLIRVRGPLTQNDAHIYTSRENLKEEFIKVINLFQEVYQEMNIKNYYFRLSLPDFNKEKFLGDKKDWDFSAQIIKEGLEETKSQYYEGIGDAAFYGPKLDVQIKNIENKEDTIATVQIDNVIPHRMGLTYINNKGESDTPIVIHRSLLGSYERFIGFFIEQTSGNFPLRFSPVQVKILPVSDKYIPESKQINDILKCNGIRSEVDLKDESISKKIRNASLEKIPAKIVIGEKEISEYKKNKDWILNINWRSDLNYTEILNINEFITIIKQ